MTRPAFTRSSTPIEPSKRSAVASGLTESSSTTTRLLELAGLRDHFVSQPAFTAPADAVVIDPVEPQLCEVITELAGIVLNAASLREDLEQVIGFSCRVLPGCDAGSIALLIDGAPTTVAVHEHVALELDVVQYRNDEGPCLSALGGERIRVDIVDADERFPHFAAGAADHRVNSVLSMPIHHHGDVVGTLNFYSFEPNAFDDTAEDIARLASSQAAHAIVRSDVLTAARQRRDQLQAHYDQTALVARRPRRPHRHPPLQRRTSPQPHPQRRRSHQRQPAHHRPTHPRHRPP